MKEHLKKLLDSIEEANYLMRFIKDDNYWIEEVKKVGLVPEEHPWVHYEIDLWKFEISVHSNWDSSPKMVKHFINGEWFDTSFPSKYPSLLDFIQQLKKEQ